MCLAQQVWGEGGQLPPCSPPLATAQVGVGNDPDNEVGMPMKVVLVGNQTRLYSWSPVRYSILPNKLSIVQSSFSQKAKMHACDLLDIISWYDNLFWEFRMNLGECSYLQIFQPLIWSEGIAVYSTNWVVRQIPEQYRINQSISQSVNII